MEYKLTPSNALVKSIINSPIESKNININFEYLIKRYKTYEQTYRRKCIKINDDYLMKIENITKKINELKKSIIKEKKFCINSEKSLKYISQIIKINADELNDDDNDNDANNIPYIILSDEYSKKRENKFNYNFINSLYKINKTYLSSNNISLFSLWDNNTINKELISYKNSFINKLKNETIKNKIFVNQIKNHKSKLHDLNIKIVTLKNQIIKFRTNKINFYKEKCNNVNSSYDNVYNKLFNNKTLKVDTLNKFYFFDNKDIFQKITDIKKYKKEIINLEKEIKLTNNIKYNYNSIKYNNLLDDIRNFKITYYEKVKLDTTTSDITDINKQLKKELNIKTNKAVIFPIIIKNIKGFHCFYNKFNKILSKKINNELQKSKEKIDTFKQDIKILKLERGFCEDELNNIKVNKKLVMNYLYYKKKLLHIERDILRESYRCDFLN